MLPRPGVAEPDGRKQPQTRRFRTAVRGRDLDENVFDIAFRVLDEHVEIAVLSEDSGIQQFVLRIVLAAAAILFDKLRVGECRLRILVQILHVGMRGRAVEVEVIFLYVLAVIAFVAGEAEEAFLENGIALVPQRESKADELVAIADAGKAVFVPAVGSRAGVIVRKVLPGVAIGAVVFAHRAPGAFAQIGSPALPVSFAVAGFGEPDLLVRHRRVNGGVRAVQSLFRPRQSLFSPSKAATLYASARVG